MYGIFIHAYPCITQWSQTCKAMWLCMILQTLDWGSTIVTMAVTVTVKVAQAGMIGFITLQQSAPSQMTWKWLTVTVTVTIDWLQMDWINSILSMSHKGRRTTHLNPLSVSSMDPTGEPSGCVAKINIPWPWAWLWASNCSQTLSVSHYCVYYT